jgi:predicted O-methyltransferase YrrM
MKHFYQDIDGWASEDNQGELLKYILKHIKDPIRIAEVGVYKGRGTAMWVTQLINAGINFEYYAIDNFEGSAEHKKWNNVPTIEEAKENLAPILDKINLIKMNSIDAAKSFPDNFFDVVYLDASHEYEDIKADINAWYPKTNNILCGDDYIDMWSGVIKAVNEFCTPNIIGTQWYIKK